MGDAGRDEVIPTEALQIENLLLQLVTEANERVQGDGCSIFLREGETSRYILRDSTVMNPYLGNYFITIRPGEQRRDNIGATKWALMARKSTRIQDLNKFRYWSHFQRSKEELKGLPQAHCELPHDQVRSFLAVGLIDEGILMGVIRVVKRPENGNFTRDDQKRLEDLVQKYLKPISGASDIGRLLEMGSMLDVTALCGQVVEVLRRMIGGRGCSIYLLSGEKDGLKTYTCMGTTGLYEVDGWRQIRPEECQKACYQYREGEAPKHLTTAVIKYHRNIFERDISSLDKQKLKEKFPDLDREGPKYVDTWLEGKQQPQLTAAGPSIFVPLFSPRWAAKKDSEEKREVLGVIIVSRPQGSPPFSEKEFRQCLSLSQRLARTVTYSRFMWLLNQPFPASDPEELGQLLALLINQICTVGGAPGATLFTVLDGKDGKELVKRSSYGLLEDKPIDPYRLPPDPSYYGSIYRSHTYKGYTLWVATFKKPLVFNSDRELTNYSPPPIHSGLGTCEVEENPPSKFLGVPILVKRGGKDEVIGVLRAAKDKDDLPFTATDEAVFSSLAARLSPVIDRLLDFEVRREIRRVHLEQFIASELKSKLEQVDRASGAESFVWGEIRQFLSRAEDTSKDEDFGTLVLDSINAMWKASKIGARSQDEPLRSFEFLEKEVLSELPGYRGHFVHQYQVFLLGYYIIGMLKTLGTPFHDTYCQSLGKVAAIPDRKREREAMANVAWLVCSTFHDVAYPLEEITRWLPKTISHFLGDEGQGITPELSLERVFFSGRQTYLGLVDQLAGFFGKLNLVPDVKEAEFRSWLLGGVAQDKDHGVLGALILLKPHFLKHDEVILPASLAIALHKRLGFRVRQQGKMAYDQFPLFFLLTYCDLVQEWGREQDPQDGRMTRLERIVVTKDIADLQQVEHHIPGKVRQNSSTLYVYCKVVVSDRVGQKLQDCEDWFGFMRSLNPCFIIDMNDQLVGSWGA